MEQKLLESLLAPSAYKEPTNSVHLLQTHVSYLFIADHYVYKIKKPVDFGFLNFTTLDQRRFYCNEEIRLNRRLCPGIYLGVVEVREEVGKATFAGTGKIIDYAVRMKRLPEERMLDRMLAEGKVTGADMRRVARTVAEFHLEAERGPGIDAYGSLERVRSNLEESFRQVADFAEITLTSRDLRLIREWSEGYLTDNSELFAKRVANGFIRECHGDIHLENISLSEEVCIFDCIEFNRRFRYSDTAADIAFILMDLDYHGNRRFAEVFLAEYMTVTGDREIVRIRDFYKVYRAVVRGKVTSFRLNDPAIPEPERKAARETACRYFWLARGYILRRRLPPTLFITCGLMGSGKSTVAAQLAWELGLDSINSDIIRKKLTGTPLQFHNRTGYGEGIYTQATTTATYQAMLASAEASLVSGRGIIIDAGFRNKEHRAMFSKMAGRIGVPFTIIQADCPEESIRRRLDDRQKQPQEVSDGRWELLHRQKEEFEPPDSDEGQLIFVDTSGSIADIVNDILKKMELLW
jgi:aminoglycoside phosphotransferase family enzyme/predicted kinase